MRFLKSLKKRETERLNGEDELFIELADETPRRDFSRLNFESIGKSSITSDEPLPKVEIQADDFAEPATSKWVKQRPLNGNGNGNVSETSIRGFSIDPAKVNPHLVAITQPNSTYCEEYRRLRTHLVNKSLDGKLRSIVISSLGPSEGKSVTAINLALLLAQTDGVKALLIDGDMRRPCAASYLGLEFTVGLSDLLLGSTNFEDAIIRIEPGGLNVIPSGGIRDDVAELLSGERFAEVLANAYEGFDFVIVDAPPIGLFSDASVLMRHSEGALLVIGANQASYKDIQRIMASEKNNNFIGVVLNRAQDTPISKEYYNYSQYKIY